MPQTVTMPDGSTIDFPDQMQPAEIQAVLDEQFGQQQAQPTPEQPAAPAPEPPQTRLQQFAAPGLGDQAAPAMRAHADEVVRQQRAGGGALQTIDDYVRMAARNVPYVGEFADELNARTRAALGGDYGTELALEQARRRAIDAEQRPGISTPVGDIDTGDVAKTAGLVGGVVAAPAAAVTKGATAVGQGLNAAVTTLLMAGADAAGRKEGKLGDKVATGLAEGLQAAPFGFVGGVAGKKLIDAARKAAPVFAANKTPSELREIADKAYKQAERSGVVFSPQGINRMGQRIQTELTEFGYHPSLQPKIKVLVDEAEKIAQGNVSLKGLDTFRKMAGKVSQSIEPAERELARKITAAVDDLIQRPKPGDVIMGNAQIASPAMTKARQAWKTMRKTETVTNAIETAVERAASTGSGGNIHNALRQEFRKLITNRKTMRQFSTGEKAAIQAFVRGSTSQNVLRRIGKLSPEGNGLMLSIHAFGGMMTGGQSLALMVAGMGAKRLSDRGATRTAEQLQQMISGGGQIGRQYSRWQNALRKGATKRVQDAATNALAAALSQATGDDPQVISETLTEVGEALPFSTGKPPQD